MSIPTLTRSSHSIESEDQWLAMRARDLTSTEIAALFGMSPYETRLQLWHRKAEGAVVKIEENERMRWGSRLEAAIAAGIAEERGWKIERRDVYGRIPSWRLGASFDYEILHPNAALLEIKNVDALQFRRKWTPEGDTFAPPPHIELQLQAEMLVGGFDRIYVAALVGGNTPHVVERAIDADICERILAESEAFWASIRDNQPPEPDYVKDADYLRQELYPHADEGREVEAGQAADAWMRDLAAWQERAKEADEEVTELKSRLLEHAKSAAVVRGTTHWLACGETKASPGKLITSDMVGTYIGARKGFRTVRLYERKENSK